MERELSYPVVIDNLLALITRASIKVIVTSLVLHCAVPVLVVLPYGCCACKGGGTGGCNADRPTVTSVRASDLQMPGNTK